MPSVPVNPNMIVYPSGVLLAICLAAIVPPAPARWSTMTCCPSVSENLSADNEAGLHGWTGRRAGRGAHILTGPVPHNGGAVTGNGPSKTRAKNARYVSEIAT